MSKVIFIATKGIKREGWTRHSPKCSFYNFKEKRCECLINQSKKEEVKNMIRKPTKLTLKNLALNIQEAVAGNNWDKAIKNCEVFMGIAKAYKEQNKNEGK